MKRLKNCHKATQIRRQTVDGIPRDLTSLRISIEQRREQLRDLMERKYVPMKCTADSACLLTVSALFNVFRWSYDDTEKVQKAYISVVRYCIDNHHVPRTVQNFTRYFANVSHGQI
jgi:hypothetical protein